MQICPKRMIRNKKTKVIGIYNGRYSIEDAGEVFNKEGEFIFHVEQLTN